VVQSSWLFGPVWAILYAMMGLALYSVLKENAENKTPALILFVVQLLFNATWSFIFFGARSIFIALVEITLLWLLIVATLFLFWRISTAAGYLLAPYLLWVTFALILNYSLWKLNGGPVRF
jgi:translocator protein